MTHFPGHLRQAFDTWIVDGLPDTATVEEGYEERKISADELLRWFMLPSVCSDTMPAVLCQHVAGFLAYSGDPRGLSYGLAACALLADRVAGDGAGRAFLERLLVPQP